MQVTTAKELMEKPKRDPAFFHALFHDPDKAVELLGKQATPQIKRFVYGLDLDALIFRDVMMVGCIVETCGEQSCSYTCGSRSCHDTCQKSCSNTCNNSCGHTTGVML